MLGPPEPGGPELFLFIGLPETVVGKLSARTPLATHTHALFLRSRNPQRLTQSDGKAAITLQEILYSSQEGRVARRRVVVQLPYPRVGAKLAKVLQRVQKEGWADVRYPRQEDGWPNLGASQRISTDELDSLLACALAICGVSELSTIHASAPQRSLVSPFSDSGESSYAFEFLRGLFSHDKFSRNKHSPLDTCRRSYPNLPRGRKRRVEKVMRRLGVIDQKPNEGQTQVWVADAALAERWFPELRRYRPTESRA